VLLEFGIKEEKKLLTGPASLEIPRLPDLTGNFRERQTIIRISSPVPKRVSAVPITLKPHAV
jgi:hypothetical protein